MIDNRTQFNNAKVESFSKMYEIKINYLLVYYPQENGMAQATNKLVVGNLRRNLEEKEEFGRAFEGSLGTVDNEENGNG